MFTSCFAHPNSYSTGNCCRRSSLSDCCGNKISPLSIARLSQLLKLKLPLVMPVCLILVMKDVTFSEDYPLRWGGHAPVNWAIFCTWIISAIRRAGIRTVPQALRLWANQVDDVFSFLG